MNVITREPLLSVFHGRETKIIDTETLALGRRDEIMGIAIPTTTIIATVIHSNVYNI